MLLERPRRGEQLTVALWRRSMSARRWSRCARRVAHCGDLDRFGGADLFPRGLAGERASRSIAGASAAGGIGAPGSAAPRDDARSRRGLRPVSRQFSRTAISAGLGLIGSASKGAAIPVEIAQRRHFGRDPCAGWFCPPDRRGGRHWQGARHHRDFSGRSDSANAQRCESDGRSAGGRAPVKSRPGRYRCSAVSVVVSADATGFVGSFRVRCRGLPVQTAARLACLREASTRDVIRGRASACDARHRETLSHHCSERWASISHRASW